MKPITIIGGGLAGLTLGILLRRGGVPVTVWEAGEYPRHRVCGEFISGNGLRIFEELKLPHDGFAATCARFHVAGKRPFEVRTDGICISRFELDQALSQEFLRLGGELRLKERISSEGPGTIHATGRRRAESGSGHLIGLKAHAFGARLSSDLELHFAQDRYVGICRLGKERVNVCGLFFSPGPIPNLSARWKELLSESIPALESATWDEQSFCSVAAITLDQHIDEQRFCVGDAAAMIPPVTGNGMSMAFESAQLAAEPVAAYARGDCSWADALKTYSAQWKAAFAGRLRWAGLAQRLAFNSTAQNLFAEAARFSPGLAQFFARRTR